MRRPLLTLVLMLLTAGCVVQRTAAVEDGTAPQAIGSGSDVREAGRRTRSIFAGRPAQVGALPAAYRLPQQVPILPRARPTMVATKRPLQCVPYARELSGIDLRGDAWSWWGKADGHYNKGRVPRPGAVLVLSKTRQLRLGHLAVVAEVRNSREIVVHQANWLNGGRIHRYTPVRDVSPANDWSEVRVWYTPGRVYGARIYAAYGFIYPRPGVQPELRHAAR